MPDPTTLIEQSAQARREGRLADAQRGYADAVRASRAADSTGDLVAALCGQAQVARDLGRSEQAVPLYREAVDAARSLENPLRLAHAVRHLGDALVDVDELPDAADAATRKRSTSTVAMLERDPSMSPTPFARLQCAR